MRFRLITETLVDHRTARRLKSAQLVTQSLQPHVPPGLAPDEAT
ncbi:hypothetical protein [Defluviicoccus vanus]|nr:hypothetical protein [Defluviicoccus vanus]